MNKWIDKLATIAASRERTILGIMSGTSMDGIDLALCRVRGKGISVNAEVQKAATVGVSLELKDRFNELAFRPESPAASILRFQTELGSFWCREINRQINAWNISAADIDLLASHGQTVLHHPDRQGACHSSWQIVDGDLLAQSLGILTVSDFRQKHIAAGYEGAPLAPLAEILLFGGEEEDRILLNLGGIANFTILEGGMKDPSVPFATDCGPANTLLDEAVKRLYPGNRYDERGLLARSGKVDEKLFGELLAHSFFSRPFPKSTGQEDFNWDWLNTCLVRTDPSLKTEDLLATLTELTAKTVGDAVKSKLESVGCPVFVSGGGWHNKFLIERIDAHLPGFSIMSSEQLGVDPDVKEAVLFAVLANEAIAGTGWTGEDDVRFTLGKISLP
ncbi:MAG: anhydro-N-acetylmuramic acid kinase [Balneolaceae bacterium]